MKNINIISKMQRLMADYASIYKSLCDELEMPFLTLDILMTLAEGDNFKSAHEVSKLKAIKPNLISFHVDKLVNAGYLERQSIEGNRRSIRLACTKKAMDVVERSRKLQSKYFSIILEGISSKDLEAFCRVMDKIEQNMGTINEGIKNGVTH